jgi:hypothetical protein
MGSRLRGNDVINATLNADIAKKSPLRERAKSKTRDVLKETVS